MPASALETSGGLLAELNRLRADVERVPLLERRLGELERAVLAGGSRREMTVEEFAERRRRSPATVRKWLKVPALRRKWRLEGVFTFDGSKLYTTEERFQKWTELIAAKGVAS